MTISLFPPHCRAPTVENIWSLNTSLRRPVLREVNSIHRILHMNLGGYSHLVLIPKRVTSQTWSPGSLDPMLT